MVKNFLSYRRKSQPVVEKLANKYSSGLWVINGTYGVLAAYGANQLFKSNVPSNRVQVNWPQELSNESINNWLKTREKGQVYRPYHTIGLSYQRGDHAIFAVKRMTGLNDTTETVADTLTLPGRYTIGTHISQVKLELSGIFSLLQNNGTTTNIQLTPKIQQQISAQLDLPSNYKYRSQCKSIRKTVPEWFTTEKVMLQCPRLPKSRIVPDFVNGEVRVDALHENLKLALRFENQNSEGQTLLKGWSIGKTTINKPGADGRMLVNVRDLPEPKNGRLTLVPPESAFSIFYQNEPISISLTNAQLDYLYTNQSVPELDGSSAINIDVPNPKPRPIETFKDDSNPWTPEALTFLCDGSQSNTELCGKTCTIDTTGRLRCDGQQTQMPLKQLEGYLVTTRFLGERWGTNSVRLKGQSLTDFFCGAWQQLFPVNNQLIVVGDDKKSVQMAKLTNPFKSQRISEELLLSAVTADQKPVWSYSMKPGEKGKDSLMNSVVWQLESVSGRYDYYLHQASGCQSNGKPLTLSIRSETICRLPTQQIRCQGPRASSATRRSNNSGLSGIKNLSGAKTESSAQIDIVAVFAENYNFQQQPFRPKFSIPGMNNIPRTGSQELRTGWMRNWNKPKNRDLLREAIALQSSQARDPSVKLHYLYDENDDPDWSWSPTPGQQSLTNAPIISTRRDMKAVIDINKVVLNNNIRPNNRRLTNQVEMIVEHVTQQWQPNGDYLLVILSDGLSEQEMAQLSQYRLPRGNGQRQLLILTSDFLPTNSQSLLRLPKLPSNTEPHTVISMYDKDWVDQFVKAIFDF